MPTVWGFIRFPFHQNSMMDFPNLLYEFCYFQDLLLLAVSLEQNCSSQDCNLPAIRETVQQSRPGLSLILKQSSNSPEVTELWDLTERLWYEVAVASGYFCLFYLRIYLWDPILTHQVEITWQSFMHLWSMCRELMKSFMHLWSMCRELMKSFMHLWSMCRELMNYGDLMHRGHIYEALSAIYCMRKNQLHNEYLSQICCNGYSLMSINYMKNMASVQIFGPSD